MMKRLAIIALSALLIFGLAGCASTGPNCCAGCGKDPAAQKTCDKAQTECSVKTAAGTCEKSQSPQCPAQTSQCPLRSTQCPAQKPKSDEAK